MPPLPLALDATNAAAGEWLGGFAAVLGVAVAIAVLYNAFRAKPPVHEVYARKDELEKLEARFVSETAHLHERVSGVRDEMQRQFAAQREAGEQRSERIIDEIKSLRGEVRDDIKGLHNRITDTQRAVSRIEGAAEPLRAKN